uniref:Uncharacterized protein n=1 Tax=Opuntia streptacantha TaxID=393608 RepID=A0A7C8Z8X8_OPUST
MIYFRLSIRKACPKKCYFFIQVFISRDSLTPNRRYLRLQGSNFFLHRYPKTSFFSLFLFTDICPCPHFIRCFLEVEIFLLKTVNLTLEDLHSLPKSIPLLLHLGELGFPLPNLKSN